MAATPDRDAARERRARDVDDDARVAARPDAAGATAETTRTPLTRTVGFAINAGARADADEASARWDGGVAMELRAMRRGPNAAGRGAGAEEAAGMAIPRGGGARDEGDADATRASRSPVMILPVRGRGKAREARGRSRRSSRARRGWRRGRRGRTRATGEAAATEEEAEEKTKTKKSESAGVGREIPPPKPKMSKAERRALQESQRAAKAAAKAGEGDARGGAGAKKSSGGGANAEGGAVSGSAGGGASGDASGAVGATEEKKKKAAFDERLRRSSQERGLALARNGEGLRPERRRASRGGAIGAELRARKDEGRSRARERVVARVARRG